MNYNIFPVVHGTEIFCPTSCLYRDFVLKCLTEFLSLHQDPASPRGTPLPSPRENGLDKARLLKKDPCSPASTASSASSSSLKSKEMSMVGMGGPKLFVVLAYSWIDQIDYGLISEYIFLVYL